MRKILALIAGILCVSGMLVSCLENEEIELSSHAYIASFSINDIKTEVLSETAEGKDTTIVYTVKGENYTFAIDHVGGEIYNVDSLPKGTDVTRVTVKLGLDAGYACYYQGEESKIFNAEDSIDFTNPVRFSVFTVDGEVVGNESGLVVCNPDGTPVNMSDWLEDGVAYVRRPLEHGELINYKDPSTCTHEDENGDWGMVRCDKYSPHYRCKLCGSEAVG